MAGDRRPPRRLTRLPLRPLGDLRLAEARGVRSRLLGLAGLDRLPPGYGLYIPHCRSVHTVGMRFAIDVVFLDAAGAVLDVARAVPPRRLVGRRGARAVVETAAGQADVFIASGLGRQARRAPGLSVRAGRGG